MHPLYIAICHHYHQPFSVLVFVAVVVLLLLLLCVHVHLKNASVQWIKECLFTDVIATLLASTGSGTEYAVMKLVRILD